MLDDHDDDRFEEDLIRIELGSASTRLFLPGRLRNVIYQFDELDKLIGQTKR